MRTKRTDRERRALAAVKAQTNRFINAAVARIRAEGERHRELRARGIVSLDLFMARQRDRLKAGIPGRGSWTGSNMRGPEGG